MLCTQSVSDSVRPQAGGGRTDRGEWQCAWEQLSGPGQKQGVCRIVPYDLLHGGSLEEAVATTSAAPLHPRNRAQAPTDRNMVLDFLLLLRKVAVLLFEFCPTCVTLFSTKAWPGSLDNSVDFVEREGTGASY